MHNDNSIEKELFQETVLRELDVQCASNNSNHNNNNIEKTLKFVPKLTENISFLNATSKSMKFLE